MYSVLAQVSLCSLCEYGNLISRVMIYFVQVTAVENIKQSGIRKLVCYYVNKWLITVI